MNDNIISEIMLLAFDEAKKSLIYDDVPVGVVITDCDYNVIYKCHNTKEKNQCVIDHAEMNAIRYLSTIERNWHLNNYYMFVTLEPCTMCMSAILASRISKLYIGTDSPKFGYSKNLKSTLFHNITIKKNICSDLCSEILKEYFRKKRN